MWLLYQEFCASKGPTDRQVQKDAGGISVDKQHQVMVVGQSTKVQLILRGTLDMSCNSERDKGKAGDKVSSSREILYRRLMWLILHASAMCSSSLKCM